MNLRSLFISSSLCFVCLLSSPAMAEGTSPASSDGVALGHPRTIVIDDLLGASTFGTSEGGLGAIGALGLGGYRVGMFGFSHAKMGFGNGELSSTRVDVAPSLDVFLTRRVTLGGMVRASHEWVSTDATGIYALPTRTTTVALAPRIGYYAPLGEDIALWARFGLGAGYTHRRFQTSDETEDVTLSAMLDLDLVVPIGRHLSFQVGPKAVASTTGPSDRVARWGSTVVALGVGGSLSYAF